MTLQGKNIINNEKGGSVLKRNYYPDLELHEKNILIHRPTVIRLKMNDKF